jgi:hypothetical protein
VLSSAAMDYWQSVSHKYIEEEGLNACLGVSVLELRLVKDSFGLMGGDQ